MEKKISPIPKLIDSHGNCISRHGDASISFPPVLLKSLQIQTVYFTVTVSLFICFGNKDSCRLQFISVIPFYFVSIVFEKDFSF